MFNNSPWRLQIQKYDKSLTKNLGVKFLKYLCQITQKIMQKNAKIKKGRKARKIKH